MSTTLIPAQPGYFAVYDDTDESDPVIAWRLHDSTHTGDLEVTAICPCGFAGDNARIEYRGEWA